LNAIKYNCIVSTLLFFFSAIPLSGARNLDKQATHKTYALVEANLRIRDMPSLKGRVIGVIPRFTTVEVIDTSGEWIHIQYNRKEGWSIERYLRLEQQEGADQSKINLYLKHSRELSIANPDKLYFLEGQSGWSYFWDYGKAGWIDQSQVQSEDILKTEPDDRNFQPSQLRSKMEDENGARAPLFDLSRFWDLTYTDRILIVLAIAITVLLVFVFLFALATIALRLKNNRKAKRWAHLESVWEPLLIRVMGGDEPEDKMHEQVGGGDALRFIDFLMRFTPHFRGEELDIIKSLARPYLHLVGNQLNDKASEMRARAIKTLSILGFERYREEIIKALDDPSPLVAMIAARAIMRKDDPELAYYVIDRLPRFMHWSVNYLSSMLAEVGPSINPALRKIFSDSTYPARTRAVCADALSELHDYTAADTAVEVLRSEDDRDICAASLRLLSAVGLPKHLPVVLELLDSDDFVIRAQAYRALGSIGGKTEIPLLESGLNDSEPWVTIQAAESLYEAGGTQTLALLANSEHPQAMLAQQILDEAGV